MDRLSSDEAVERAAALAAVGRRTIVGLVGCPGAGKSTLSARILDVLGPASCVVVPMDGFHLDNAVLEARSTRDRKGAPFTFDAVGYAALLRRLRTDETVFAPRYDRARSTSVAGAIEVRPDVPLVITEGNYLLLDESPWNDVPPCLDECWYVEIADEIRVPRLIARHVEFGKTPEVAHEWVHRSDEANAALVKASAHRAYLHVAV